MNALHTVAAVMALAVAPGSVSAGAAASSGQAQSPSVYRPGSEYTATLDQTGNRWLLQPIAGQDVSVDIGACATGAMVPAGVWLLVFDDNGLPGLLAPSATRLPSGQSGYVALRDCGQARGRELAVPQVVLDLLTATTGAIYVKR